MAGPKILVVDDSTTIRRIVVNTLNHIGYSDIVEAPDGHSALLSLKEHSFDLVITDWMMPEIDGFTLTSIMRQSEDYRDIPILMVTSRSAEDDIVAALKAGVDNYVVKPFTAEVLKAKIDQILSGL